MEATEIEKELIVIAKYINANGIKSVYSRLDDNKRITAYKGANFKATVNRNKEAILKQKTKHFHIDDSNITESLAEAFLKYNIMKKYIPLYEPKEDIKSKAIPEYLKECPVNPKVILLLDIRC